MNCVARHLEKHGITQEQFAERIGVRQPTVWAWVNDEKRPDLENAAKIARELGISTTDVLADFSPEYFQ